MLQDCSTQWKVELFNHIQYGVLESIVWKYGLGKLGIKLHGNSSNAIPAVEKQGIFIMELWTAEGIWQLEKQLIKPSVMVYYDKQKHLLIS